MSGVYLPAGLRAPVSMTVMTATRETPWMRLHRVAEARRQRLGITQEEVKARGGPSPSSVQSWRHHEGARVSVREQETLRGLDLALGWPSGSAASLVAETRSAMLSDLEERLLEDPEHLSTLAWMVETRLRDMSPRERQAALTKIGEVLGLRLDL